MVAPSESSLGRSDKRIQHKSFERDPGRLVSPEGGPLQPVVYPIPVGEEECGDGKGGCLFPGKTDLVTRQPLPARDARSPGKSGLRLT